MADISHRLLTLQPNYLYYPFLASRLFFLLIPLFTI